MLRLAPPGFERFLQSPQFVATFGGGEANVAVAVAGFGLPGALCHGAAARTIPSPTPSSARCGASASIRRTSSAARAASASTSSSPAPTSGLRKWSTIATTARSRWPSPATSIGRQAFEGAGWFHITGITPAISQIAGGPRAGERAQGAREGPHRLLRSQLPQESVEVRQGGRRGHARAVAVRRRRHRQRRGLPDGARHQDRRRRPLRRARARANIAS